MNVDQEEFESFIPEPASGADRKKTSEAAARKLVRKGWIVLIVLLILGITAHSTGWLSPAIDLVSKELNRMNSVEQQKMKDLEESEKAERKEHD